MRTRHKIPVVFSIYMVDVLCCTLGCVILLWQLYHHESEEQTAKNEEIRKENDAALKINEEIRKEKEAALKKLEQAHLAISSLNSDVASLKVSLDASNKKKIQVTLELDDTRKDRDKKQQLALVLKQEYDDLKKIKDRAEALLAALRLDIKKEERKTTTTAAELADKIRAHAGLLDRLAEAEKKISLLTKDLVLKEGETRVVVKRVEEKSNLLKQLEQELNLLRSQSKDNSAKLSTADLRARILEQNLDRGRKELLDVNRRYNELNLSQDHLSQRMLISVKDLDKARQALSALETDKISLIKKAKAAENRFAGIALTGRRVIFLVDMSGSMAMVDDNTYDPDKWPTVCDTVSRLMGSLPELREFQVIVFSDKVKFAFGNEGKWLPYDPETSPKKVADGLKAIKPKGGTDMYAAFENVFNYRDAGLDTVYFFSDGLPNMGEGLPPNAASLTESQLGEILGRLIRGRLKSTWNRPLPNQARVRINCIGFFFESPDVGAFLWALAREHDGRFVGMR